MNNNRLRAAIATSRRGAVGRRHFRSCHHRGTSSSPLSSLRSSGHDGSNDDGAAMIAAKEGGASFGGVGHRNSSAVTAVRPAMRRSLVARRGVRGSSGPSSAQQSSSSSKREEERLLIVGSGVAGCSAALTAARAGVAVTVIHAGSVASDCNSYWAQGGIIYRNYDLMKTTTTTTTTTTTVPRPPLRAPTAAAATALAELASTTTIAVATTSSTSSKSKEELVDSIVWEDGRAKWRNSTEEGEGRGGGAMLVDTPASLVNDIRLASGYVSNLIRKYDDDDAIDECSYTKNMHVNTIIPPPPASGGGGGGGGVSGVSELGRKCDVSGVTWNEDAAWKLALEGPTRVRQLLLGHVDFDHTTTTTASASALVAATTATTNVGGTRCIIDFDRSTSSSNNNNDEDGGLSLCLEASHSAPRIIHQADRTGRAITEGITSTAAHHPLISFMSDGIVVDLLYDDTNDDNDDTDGMGLVIGARVLDTKTNTITNQYAVHGVVLASGGLCGIYEHTTNPAGFNALGSSVALALRLEDDIRGGGGGGGITGGAGIVSDLEYVQFHPTALCIPNESRFLLTEALRGEGAILRDANGRAFAKDYHANGELAPRDVVARAVYAEMSRKSTIITGQRWESNWETVHHSDFVGRSDNNWSTLATAAQVDVHNAYLDITHRDAEWLRNRFPGVHAYLMSRSIPLDFTKDMIPVTPAAHYTCGGVTTDLDGRVITSARNSSRRQYRNLYAAGEAARTGLHGGNRLASTSLLEGLVFGSSVGDVVATADHDSAFMKDRARRAIERRLLTSVGPYHSTSSSSDSRSATTNADIAREAAAILTRLKSVMWNDVGVVRTPAGLDRAVSELTAMCNEAERLWDTGEGGREAAALRDASRSGLAVADAALRNRISGGCHYLAPMAETEQQNDCDDDDDDEEDGQVMARA